MHFGIMAMQIGSLIPAGLSVEQMQGYVAGFSHAKLVGGLYQAGFDLIELGGDLAGFIPEAFAPDQVQALGELADAEGLRYTVHLPLWSVEPSTPLGPVREGSVRATTEIIEATAPLAPEVYVFHATGALAAEFASMSLPPMGKALILRRFQQGAMESLGTILATIGLPSRRLAIETIEFPMGLTLEMADALDLSLCLDVGHVLSGFSGPVGLLEAVDLCSDRLAEIHLHDAVIPESPGTIVYGRDHQPLGSGDLDVGAFLDHVVATGFDGPVIFELTVEEAQASLDFVRTVRPALVS